MTAGPGQPRPRPLLIRHMMTNRLTKALPPKPRSKRSSSERSLVRVCFPDASERLRGVRRVNGAGSPSKLYARDV
jgi:hypothetical protein